MVLNIDAGKTEGLNRNCFIYQILYKKKIIFFGEKIHQKISVEIVRPKVNKDDAVLFSNDKSL